MIPESAGPRRDIKVALRVADPSLAEWIEELLLDQPGLRLLAPDADEELDADVAIADGQAAIAGVPTLALASRAAMLDARRSGLHAVLPLDVGRDQLRAAIEAVAHGFVLVAAECLDEFVAQPRPDHGPSDRLDIRPALTERETEVLQLLAEGASNKLIARRLEVSFSTAKFHVASLLAKLGARNRADAVAQGARRGLVML